MKYIYLFISLLLGIQAIAQHTHPDSLAKHVHYLASEELQGRGLGTEGKDKATTYILQQFQAAGLQPFQGEYTQPFDLKFSLAWVKATNVIGLIEGSDSNLKHEYIVLGAHYDHLGYKKDKKAIYPGADDNASGVATIIELTKYFTQEANRPKRSLIFIAFDAEESGLLGSKHFVKSLDESTRQQIKAMFSFDMVGMLTANKGLNLKGISTIKNGKEIAKRYANDINLRELSSGIEERTDTEPFGLKGIPAVHVFTGLKSPYHKPGDKAELLDYEGMGKVADFTARLVAELASQAEIEPTASMQSLQRNPGRTLKPVRVGLNGYIGQGRHLYKDEFYDAKAEIAFSIGLHLNYKLTKSLAVQLEGLYDQNTSQSAQGKFVRNAIMTPLNIQYGKMGYIEAGAYFKHHFDGNNGGEALDFDNHYRKNEWGYNMGLGMRFSNYHFGVIRRGSFQSIFQQGPKVIPRALYVNLGYSF